MNYEFFNELPTEAKQIRETVFVKEQGFCDEFDETDSRAIHLVAFDGSIPAATCRFFKEHNEESYTLGRFAVLKQYRGQNIGAKMLEKAEQQIRAMGGTQVQLHAQQQASHFYEKQGYQAFGEIEPEQGCPHVWMRKKL